VNPSLKNLIALQDIELKITTLQKQISETPNKVQSLKNDLERLCHEHQDRVVRLQDLSKRRRAREGEVDMMRSKLSRFKDQLMAVKTNKEYTAMLHEIKMAEDQIRAEEDKILEIMEEMEIKEGELKKDEKELNSRTAELEGRIRQAEAAVPGIEAEVARLIEMKAATESSVEPDLLSRYRRIAEARKGIALAEAKDELCTACHVRIRPQVYADLLHTETIHTCDSCSRILFMREAR
jgi:predicted  nucleic acid-binding Zn-ribbon protein